MTLKGVKEVKKYQEMTSEEKAAAVIETAKYVFEKMRERFPADLPHGDQAVGILGTLTACVILLIEGTGTDVPDWDTLEEVGMYGFKFMSMRIDELIDQGRISR